MTNTAKAKGSAFEREVAALLSGKRMPLSGAAGGGDVALPEGSIFADWSWEAKRRARLPALVVNALAQAAADIGIGDRRKPAVVMREDRGATIFACYLGDFIGWSQALAETGRGYRLRALARELRAIATELEAVT